MKKLFLRNINGTGRVLRALFGCLLMLAGWLLCRAGHKWAGLISIFGGGFAWFEAARGWCVMRACGIKTKW